MTLVPASHRRRTARRSSSTSPPHTPCAPMPNACRSESSRQSGRTGQRAQTAERGTTDCSVQILLNERTGCDARQKCMLPAFRTSANAA